jgi:hypothetical protein
MAKVFGLSSRVGAIYVRLLLPSLFAFLRTRQITTDTNHEFDSNLKGSSFPFK